MKMMKRLLIYAYFMLFLLCFTYWGIDSYINSNVSEYVSGVVGANVEIGHVDIKNIYRGVVIFHNVSLFCKDRRSKNKVIDIKTVKIHVSLGTLFSKCFFVNSIDLDTVFIKYNHSLKECFRHIVSTLNAKISHTDAEMQRFKIKTLVITNLLVDTGNVNYRLKAIAFLKFDHITGKLSDRPIDILQQIEHFDRMIDTPYQIFLYPKIFAGKIGNESFDVSIIANAESGMNHHNEIALINNEADANDDLQLGLINKTHECSNGIQIGIINYASGGQRNLQLGFINVMPDGFLPVFPIVNFSI
jgi:hypothetical protein